MMFLTACGSDQSGPDASGSAPSTQPASGGNGIADKSANEILAAAQQALKSAQSVHLKGALTDKGETIKLNLWVTRTQAKGSITAPQGGKTYTIDVIKARGRFYMHAPAMFRAVGGAAAAQVIGNRWVLVPKGDKDFKDFETLVHIPSMAKEMLTPDGAVAKGKQTVIDGKPVIGLDAGDGTLYVATSGRPYPVKLVPLKPATPGEELAFLDYDQPVKVKPPARPLDLSKL
ncbi:MAG TPA: hypothetical protein VFU43_09515 [Streptosporangiaceae bacterium]|nr:hypothetical protein [Streptosporangiaceae bacterium]